MSNSATGSNFVVDDVLHIGLVALVHSILYKSQPFGLDWMRLQLKSSMLFFSIEIDIILCIFYVPLANLLEMRMVHQGFFSWWDLKLCVIQSYLNRNQYFQLYCLLYFNFTMLRCYKFLIVIMYLWMIVWTNFPFSYSPGSTNRGNRTLTSFRILDYLSKQPLYWRFTSGKF